MARFTLRASSLLLRGGGGGGLIVPFYSVHNKWSIWPPLPLISMKQKWRVLLFLRLHHCFEGWREGLIEDTININSGELHLIMSKIALLLMLSSDTRWIAAELCVSHKDIFASFIDQTSDYCTSRRIKQDCKYYSLHWKFLLYSFSIMHTLSWEMLVQ